MTDDYTPSTDEVRIFYIGTHPTLATGNEVRRIEEFNRWLESVRAEERERIARNIEVKMRRHDHARLGFSAIGDAYADAARIARRGA